MSNDEQMRMQTIEVYDWFWNISVVYLRFDGSNDEGCKELDIM